MNYTKPIIVSAVVLGTLIAAGTASAERGHKSGHHGFGANFDFSAIDVDSNGEITTDELIAHAQKGLQQADGNGDGSLDRAELIAGAPQRGSKMFNLFGKDRAEVFVDRMLERHDATDAGKIEIAALAGNGAERLMKRADSDGDGVITTAEAEKMKEHRGRKKHGHKQKNGKDDS